MFLFIIAAEALLAEKCHYIQTRTEIFLDHIIRKNKALE